MADSTSHVIGVDIGSSSAKAMAVDRRGRVHRTARVRFPTRRGPGGRVEHDAAALLRATLSALGSAAGSLAPGQEAALGIATQRSTFLFWDRDSGRAVTPAFSWQDLRAAALCRRLTRDADALLGATGRPGGVGGAVAQRTGLRLSAHYAAAKIAAALRSEPELRRRVAAGRVLWGTLGCWLMWHLTRGGLYAIDHANAQRTLLFDLDELAWSPPLFEMFRLTDLLDAPSLPALTPTRMASGATCRVGGRRLLVRASTGDQQAALQGLLCRRAGDMAINYGSGAFVLVQVGGEAARVPGLLTTLVDSRHLRPGEPPAPGGCAASFAVEGTVNAAATALDWVGRRIRRRIRTADLDRILGPFDAAASRRVHFLPAVSGLGAPRWDERARAAFFGPVEEASVADLLRAAVESIAQRCAEIARAAEIRHAPSGGRAAGGTDHRTAVRVSGGLTRCLYLLQAQADLLERSLVVPAARDATALGAAWMAAGGAHGEALRAAGEAELIIQPRAAAGRAAILRRNWMRAVYGRAGGGGAGGPAGLR